MDFFGAEDRARTGHPNLGKVVLYQMSYFRVLWAFQPVLLRTNWSANINRFLNLPTNVLKKFYCPKIHAKINGATMVASLSTMNLGVFTSSLPQVIFSLGTAPE